MGRWPSGLSAECGAVSLTLFVILFCRYRQITLHHASRYLIALPGAVTADPPPGIAAYWLVETSGWRVVISRAGAGYLSRPNQRIQDGHCSAAPELVDLRHLSLSNGYFVMISEGGPGSRPRFQEEAREQGSRLLLSMPKQVLPVSIAERFQIRNSFLDPSFSIGASTAIEHCSVEHSPILENSRICRIDVWTTALGARVLNTEEPIRDSTR